MSTLTLFGLVAVTLMMLCYWLEERRAIFTLAFGVACLASSAYGWLSGTWPFGIVEMVWGALAFVRWYRKTRHPGVATKTLSTKCDPHTDASSDLGT